MKDTIVTVLAAQEKARATVEAARDAVRKRLTVERTKAQAIVERNAGRSLRAIRAFEKHCARELKREIAQVERQAQEREERFLATCDRELKPLVDRAFREFWPER